MKPAAAFSGIDLCASNAIAVKLLTDLHLGQKIRDTDKLSIKRLRQSIDDAVFTACATSMRPTIDSVEVHQRLLKGLPGEAMFITCAIAFDTFREGQAFFGLSSKSARQRIGQRLDAVEGEKALRVVCAALLAGDVLGSPEEGRTYLTSPNVALGGMTPRGLLMTAEGGRLVLNELHTHADGGPI